MSSAQENVPRRLNSREAAQEYRPGRQPRVARDTVQPCKGERNQELHRRIGNVAGAILSVIILGFAPSAQTVSTTPTDVLRKLVAAAVERTHHSVRYVSSYVSIPYPNGDVPADTGVCTDEIIRIYRTVGIDLQEQVHEDMVRNFAVYPHKWQRRPDSNIDHRRVPNLMVFFSRKGLSLPITAQPKRLFTRRHRSLGPRRRHHSHRDGGRSERSKRTFHGCAQHRTRTADGRRALRLEDHWTLSLLRAAS